MHVFFHFIALAYIEEKARQSKVFFLIWVIAGMIPAFEKIMYHIPAQMNLKGLMIHAEIIFSFELDIQQDQGV